MRRKLKLIMSVFLISIFLISMNVSAISINNQNISNENENKKPLLKSNHDYSKDIEPLGDLGLTFIIKEIRAYDRIDAISDPDFFVRLIVNGDRYQSKIWHNQKYVKEEYQIPIDLPEDQENVSITIQLWDWNLGLNRLCDISNNFDGNFKYVNIEYNTKNGHWKGDDSISYYQPPPDPSGYGRLNGCDDNTYDRQNRDCELIFDIVQTDPDGDGIPSWTEENIFGTDPAVDDTGRDDDGDGVPIEWEYKWGHILTGGWHGPPENIWFYDPFKWEDHDNMDPDKDGLDNVEEYLTSAWGSDPHRQDIFLELDQMEIQDGKGAHVPQLAKDELRDAFGKHNIAFIIDDHEEDIMTGGELIPFIEVLTDWNAASNLRERYFLHMNQNNWRKGVFHYAVVVCSHERAEGFAFDGDSFLLDSTYCEEMSRFSIINVLATKKITREEREAKVYASLMMHETGHVLGIYSGNTRGCDNRNTYQPWQLGFWKWGNYRSCMNYRWVMDIVDYSDGTHGKNDFDDWARIDLTLFQN
jgi:hypothetical protein